MTSSKHVNIFLRFCLSSIIAIAGLVGTSPQDSAYAARDEAARSPIPLQAGSLVQGSVLSWNTFLSANLNCWVNAVAVDASGDSYAAGSSSATWGSPVRPYAAGQCDAFVAKLDGSGALLWNTFLGGSGYDDASSIAVDANGDIYVAGYSDVAWGSPLRPFGGDGDAFVAKLDSSGALLWSTFLGGSTGDSSGGIEVNGSGNVVVTGASGASWGSPVNPFAGGYEDAFIAALDTNGSLIWNTFLGGSGYDSADDIALDVSGNAYIVGWSSAAWGSPLSPLPLGASNAVLVAKLDSTGALTWNTFLGGSMGSYGYGLALDGGGNIYITGQSHDTWGSPVNPFTDAYDTFVARLDTTGALVWNTFLGGSIDQYGQSGMDIALDSDANAYIVGTSDASWGTPVRPFAGDGFYDAFVASVDSTGALAWNTFLGGADIDYGSGIAVDAAGSVYAVGQSSSTWGTPVHPFEGNNSHTTHNAFVAKLGSAATPILRTISGNAGADGVTLAYDDGGVKSVVSVSDGTYALGVSYNWSGTVTPSKTGYAFSPPTRTYSCAAIDQAQQDFAASVVTAPQRSSLAQGSSLYWNSFLGGNSMDGAMAVALDAEGNAYIAGASLGGWGNPVNALTCGEEDTFVAKVDSRGALLWNTFLGSMYSDGGFGIAVDANGNTYVIGNSEFPWGNPVNPYAGGHGDAFVAKLDSNGALLWNTFLGGSGYDAGNGIAVDADGNAYIIGDSQLTWGDPVNPFAGSMYNPADAFVAKLGADGSLLWNTFLGGAGGLGIPGADSGYGIAVDGSRNVYVTGVSLETWGTPVHPFAGGGDAFVAKLEGSGALAWNTFLGGGSYDAGNGIALDADANIYIVGVSEATWGAPVNPFAGAYDAFIAKLNSSGGLAWNTFLGGAGSLSRNGIALDGDANAYVTGYSVASWGAPVRPFAGASDAFVARVGSTGVLAWNTFLGGVGHDDGSGIALDGQGNVYAVGGSSSTWGNPLRPFSDQSAANAFVAKLGDDGSFTSISGNAGAGGAVLSYHDGSDKTTIADSSGNYAFSVSYGWSGTITPSKPSHTFDPASRSYTNVTNNLAGQDFTTIQEASSWNTFLGGSPGTSIVVDAAGNIYVAGYSAVTWGSPVRPFAGVRDAFVAKLDSTGALIWNTFLGGSGDDIALGIAVDGSGNVVVVGPSEASWGSPIRAYTSGSGFWSDAFVAKLDANGALVWNTFLGGSNSDYGFDIALDASGSAYIVGGSGATWGTPVLPYAGGWDAFVAKVDSNGALAWNTFLGSNTATDGYGIALDGTGNIYITGLSNGTWGSPVNPYSGNSDAFVAKLDSTGALAWNTFVGEDTCQIHCNIAVDAAGNIYVAGKSDAPWGSPVRPFAGVRDAFVAKLGSTGALLWNTFLGGGATDEAWGIAADAAGNAYIAGLSAATWGAPVRPFAGGPSDAFVAKLDTSGALASNTFLGGTGDDAGWSIALDEQGNVYALGASSSTWGNPIHAFSVQSGSDAFVARLLAGQLSGLVVTNANDSGPGSLRQAIADAAPGDTIIFDPSLAGQTIRLASTLDVAKSLTIDGHALTPHVVVSGDTNADGTGELMPFHVAPGVTAELDDLEITAGFAPSTSVYAGGINNEGTLRVVNCYFLNNTGGEGGAISNSGSMTVVDSTFVYNRGADAAAILNGPNASLTITGSDFNNNTAQAVPGGYGGGAGAVGNMGTLYVSGSTFKNNTGGMGGGAIANAGPDSATILSSTFAYNTTSGQGGAIYNLQGSLTVDHSSFQNNNAYEGAAITAGNPDQSSAEGGSAIIIRDSSFIDNRARQIGGISLNQGSEGSFIDASYFSKNYGEQASALSNLGVLAIQNSTFADNVAMPPGGAQLATIANLGSLKMTNNTVSGNTGGGLLNLGFAELFNNILANTTSGADCLTASNGTIAVNTNNLIEVSTGCGTPAITSDPMLDVPADNGGPTFTMALLPGSPAIDAGNDANCPATDQRGFPRPQGAHCDLGAYELTNTQALLVSPSGLVPAGWDGTFHWTGVTGASMYYVQILQANDTNVWTQWYTAADACTGLACHVTLSSLSNLPTGDYKWRVLDWGGYGYGAWTDFMPFNTNPACYALTTSVLPAGSGSVNATAPNCGANYLAGTVVQLTAVPNAGYVFNNWSGSASGTANPVSITMTGDLAVTANQRETASMLVSPSGSVPAGWDGTFSWTGVTGASMYYVQILQADDTNVWTQWYTAAGNCTGSDCHITLSSLSTLPTGGYKWRVLDWGDYGYGAWTDFTPFNTNPACYALTTSVFPAGSGTINATPPNCGANYQVGTVVQLSAVPGAGYVFNNWSGGASGTSNPLTVTISGDLTVTANLRETSSKLVLPSGAVPGGWDGTFSWSGVTGASMYYVQILQADDTNVWTQWYTAAGNCTGADCHITLSSLSNLPTGDYKWRVLDWGGYGYGAWTDFTPFNTNPACYTLTTSVLPAGSGIVNVTAPNCGANYRVGTAVQLTAVPGAGYVFNNWSGGASGTSNPVLVTMTGDMTVTANQRETSAELKTPKDAVPAGWDGTFSWTGVTGASMYYVQILQADDTNVWTQWYAAAGNCTGSDCHITLSSLSTLPTGGYKWRVLDWGEYGYGAWTEFTPFSTNQACYALTMSVVPVGSGVVNVTAPNCGANYQAGTVVQLTAVPGAGYVFNNWSGGASGTSNPVTVTMTGDLALTANLRETASTLVSPSGAVPAGWDGTFSWTGVTGASMYYVQILQADDTNVWTQWYPAADNCTGLDCHVTLSSLSALPTGAYKWRVLDWGDYGYGAWTAFKAFQMP